MAENYEPGYSAEAATPQKNYSSGDETTGPGLPFWAQITVLTTLSSFIIEAIISNVLVIYLVFTYRPLYVGPNFFIVSLSSADLAVAVLVMPFSTTYLALGEWRFGMYFCKIWQTCGILCCTASILTLCAIAVNRYLAIADAVNYNQKCTKRRVLGAIASVWILSSVISLPPWGGWNDWPEDIEPGAACKLIKLKKYVVYSSLGSFFIPLVLMSFFNGRTFLAIRRRQRELTALTSARYRNAERALSKERHAAKALGIVMIVFVACWLPFFSMYVTEALWPDLWSPSDTCVYIVMWLGYINSVLNPIIYTIFNREFRRAFTTLLGRNRLRDCSDQGDDGYGSSILIKTKTKVNINLQMVQRTV